MAEVSPGTVLQKNVAYSIVLSQNQRILLETLPGEEQWHKNDEDS